MFHERAPLLLQRAPEPHPFLFELIRMRGFRFLFEMALSHCSDRSGRTIHNLSPACQYGEKTDSDVVRIAQLGRINEG